MKKILFFCIIFSISLLFGNDILLKTKTVIEGNEVYLKDVILSHNLQSIQIDRIKNIIIRTLPDDNNFCNISSKSIARLLNYYVDEEIKIKGGLCSVRKKNKTILPESIRIAARKFISKKLKNEKVHITFYSIPKIVKPPKDFDILFSTNSGFEKLGNIVLNGTISKDKTVERKFRINVRVEVEKKVVILNKNKNRNEEISAKDVTFQTITINNYYNVITKKSAVVGKIAKRYLAYGTILRENYFKEKPAVKRGDKVDIEIMVGPVLISYKAISKEEGYIGENIECQNPDSNEIFLATIVGKNKLQIYLEER